MASKRNDGVVFLRGAERAASESDTLRLTDAEREALVRNLRHGNGMWLMHVSQGDKAVIDALLERHAK